ncbi:MAG: NUDIX domain-containing protein [Candidatus Aenigmarchaeota archaeon]|nr:NUDIX domain-containing protein [Candidatus Aenigmarchaeota archaeon]
MTSKVSKKIPYKLFSKILKVIPILTVDGVIVVDGKILLLKRSIKPFRGYWVLPGGRVEFGETVEEAVMREAKEETGLDVEVEKMIGIYSDPKRDPRGHSITISYLLKPLGGEMKPDKDEASSIKYFRNLPKNIGFDHRKIIMDAKRLIRTLKV